MWPPGSPIWRRRARIASSAVPDTTPSCPCDDTARARRQSEMPAPIPPWMMRGRRSVSVVHDLPPSGPRNAPHHRQRWGPGVVALAQRSVGRRNLTRSGSSLPGCGSPCRTDSGSVWRDDPSRTRSRTPCSGRAGSRSGRRARRRSQHVLQVRFDVVAAQAQLARQRRDGARLVTEELVQVAAQGHERECSANMNRAMGARLRGFDIEATVP